MCASASYYKARTSQYQVGAAPGRPGKRRRPAVRFFTQPERPDPRPVLPGNPRKRYCRLEIEQGVPLEGVCLYPILDRFDWDDGTHWHNTGLWDLHKNGDGHYRRVLNEEYARALHTAGDLRVRLY